MIKPNLEYEVTIDRNKGYLTPDHIKVDSIGVNKHHRNQYVKKFYKIKIIMRKKSWGY
jgi:hypothetical protein